MLNAIKSLILVIAWLALPFEGHAKPESETYPDYKVETIAESLNSPWSLAFLPGGDYLVSELSGRLIKIDINGSKVTEIAGVPDIYYAGQGGLFDVVVDKDYLQNKRIYLSFAHGEKGANATRMVSAVLENNTLTDIQVLFTAKPLKSTPHHYGGRVAQLEDGTLLLTVGDGFNYREYAQKLDNHLGKVVRITTEGHAPLDNPWVSQENALAEIWSMGHRNQQAILVTPEGLVYENEHGPKGGDEINLIESGNNYGWPVITNGIDYNGASITPYTEYPGMQQPLLDWTPSIAPAGMALYRGSVFPEWQGNLLIVSLAEKSVRRINLDDGGQATSEHILPELNSRMRDIRVDERGNIYILTDGKDGKLLKISRQER